MPHVASIIVLGCWLAFGVVFAMRRPAMGRSVAKRDTRSIFGIAVGAIAFALVWAHPTFYPQKQGMGVLLAGPIALVSVTFAIWAILTLGTQWSIQAQLKANHQLVTTGPYRFVRHPIYTSFFGLLIATGLVFSDSKRLAIGIVLYFICTTIRIRSEESLLRQEFGATFDTYARNTPAVLPFVGKAAV
jgi:protein-S-isoprenylcysteine O-methyltransferase Ste14